ncbi:MAG: urea transporter, partial [Pirellulaceae bacterium]|nr:urea transporter [Pirellulaceae bacterium]
MTDLSVKDGANGWWAFSVDSVLHSYSIIYFSQRRWMGLLLLLCTLHSPAFGLIGLGGVVVSLCAALLIGFDRSLIR